MLKIKSFLGPQLKRSIRVSKSIIRALSSNNNILNGDDATNKRDDKYLKSVLEDWTEQWKGLSKGNKLPADEMLKSVRNENRKGSSDYIQTPRYTLQPEEVIDKVVRGNGSRKTASARAYLFPISKTEEVLKAFEADERFITQWNLSEKYDNNFLVNSRNIQEYFSNDTYYASRVLETFAVTNTLKHVKFFGFTEGGGKTGQCDSLRMAVARALVMFNPGFKKYVRQHEMLTRDPRKVERHKPGQPGARKQYTWVKR